MARRRRQPYVLGPRPRYIPLTGEEIDIVLRAADELVGAGGRNLLTKVLKGSKDKRVLEHGLDANPCYGVWHDRSTDEVLAIVDQVIVAGFLTVTYSGRLPVLVYTDAGWYRERHQYVGEMLEQWKQWVDAGVMPMSMEYLKDRNRPMILEFQERVRDTQDPGFIPLLERWAAIDYKKVRARIRDVIHDLRHLEPPKVR